MHASDVDFIDDDSEHSSDAEFVDARVEPENRSTKDDVERLARLLGSASKYFDELTVVPDEEIGAQINKCVQFAQNIISRGMFMLAGKPKKRKRFLSE